MEIFTTCASLRERLDRESRPIGFVPTMGALHRGHLSLLERCCKENALSVVSVFVNPTQFNDKNDLKRYPRTPEQDMKIVEEAGVDVAFLPSETEIYPERDDRVFDFGDLDKVMEGASRPGHFNGVAQVVSRLFDIVKPDNAYFGEKDFQQVAIIRALVAMLGYEVNMVDCPIVREHDGLALSSRNVLLEPHVRESVPLICAALKEAAGFNREMPVAELRRWVVDRINEDGNLKVIYFNIVDRNSLKEVAQWVDFPLQGCVAVQAGKVRLIDNIRF